MKLLITREEPTVIMHDGALFYFVEGQCGSPPCMPYIAGMS
jgi:hypothetical protein